MIDEEANSGDETTLVDVFFGALSVGCLMFIVLLAFPHDSTGPAMQGNEKAADKASTEQGATEYDLYRLIPQGDDEMTKIKARNYAIKTLWTDTPSPEGIVLVDGGRTGLVISFAVPSDSWKPMTKHIKETKEQLTLQAEKYDKAIQKWIPIIPEN